MGPGGMYPWVPKELASVTSRSVLVIFWKVVVPKGWKKQKSILSLRKARTASLTLISVMEQVILQTISKHLKDKKLIWNGQHQFMRGKSCLTNLMAFCSETTISGWGESIRCCLSQHWQGFWLLSPLASWQTNRWSVDSEADWQLAELPGSRGCDQQHKVQTEAVTGDVSWVHCWVSTVQHLH